MIRNHELLTQSGDEKLPLVALVGRPNVGKSTLFNRLTRSKRAIIDPNPGMTRDRLYGTIEDDRGAFRIVDTGGLDVGGRMEDMISEQTKQAIAKAQIIVFMLDGREGILAGDEEIAAELRKCGKPIVVFINKLDGGTGMKFDTAFYEFGFTTMIEGSAEHRLEIDTLLDEIHKELENFDTQVRDDQQEHPIRLAIIGRPNAGKSSIVNKLLKEDRVMVSQIAGTTRDPIDSYLTFKDQLFCIVDTAGIRKRGKIEGSQEHLSVMMAKRQVQYADLICVVIDASEPEAVQDAAIAGIANDAFRPTLILVNKWDLVKDKDTNTAKFFEDRIRRRLKFLEKAPFLFVSAKTGQRISKILDLGMDLMARANARVSTGVLNRFVEDMKKNHRFPSHKGYQPKIYYMTQVQTNPPTFVTVINTRKPLHFSQERFLTNRIREAFDLHGIPIKLIAKPRS
ncbi:MAG: ribosome biogenesis GTPase Der [Acidobacteria bacterium]|nr:MAG: ribosome biogenesis GTPase Der [Acidobacteriota bacterium]PIE89692.1 MAG: ribosome biogenesis GTPase Der [Acidobacteriota bacterium]